MFALLVVGDEKSIGNFFNTFKFAKVPDSRTGLPNPKIFRFGTLVKISKLTFFEVLVYIRHSYNNKGLKMIEKFIRVLLKPLRTLKTTFFDLPGYENQW